MKSVVVNPAGYDWEGDKPLARPSVETIIYELHVRGFTRHESSLVAPEKRGTYAGLIDKIPYLKELGVTAVELLPVFQFDPHDAPPGLVNYWGYQPISFFAPHVEYSSHKHPLAVVDAYCQHNELGWFDWSSFEQHRDIHRFVALLNAFRARRNVVAETGKLSLNRLLQRANVQWHGVELGRPDWGEHSHALAFSLQSLQRHFLFHGPDVRCARARANLGWLASLHRYRAGLAGGYPPIGGSAEISGHGIRSDALDLPGFPGTPCPQSHSKILMGLDSSPRRSTPRPRVGIT